MDPVYPANVLSVWIVAASITIVPFYLLATYVASGASFRKGFWISSGWILGAGLMTWVCLYDVINQVGPAGDLIVPLAWVLPSLLLVWKQDWFLARPLSQTWLIQLQYVRVIGGVFLLEMMRGNIPPVFALPAGVGDILVALLAVFVVWQAAGKTPSPAAIKWVYIVGMLDFASAFFFGYTANENVVQLFFPERNNLILYPTGMIPLYLVPSAIFFHTLSLLQLRRDQASVASTDPG